MSYFLLYKKICHTEIENLLNFIGQSLGYKSLYKRSQAGRQAKGDNSHPKPLLPSK